jgi:presenilin-like A22 family membrane protease
MPDIPRGVFSCFAEIFSYRFDNVNIVSWILSVAVVALYAFTKHWTLSNLLAEAFALGALAVLGLDSFATGLILLAGLFVYDIFWVFGTEVMVSVAKSFDAPVKILFPKNLIAALSAPQMGKLEFAMLGLGDIVIPGKEQFFPPLLLASAVSFLWGLDICPTHTFLPFHQAFSLRSASDLTRTSISRRTPASSSRRRFQRPSQSLTSTPTLSHTSLG